MAKKKLFKTAKDLIKGYGLPEPSQKRGRKAGASDNRKVTLRARELPSGNVQLYLYSSYKGKATRFSVGVVNPEEDEAAKMRNTDIVPTAGVMIDEVWKFYNIDPAVLKGQGRAKDISMARQIAMYLIRRMTNLSLKEIGKEFEGRDHTTVLHSIERIEKMVKESPETAEIIKDITANINIRYE